MVRAVGIEPTLLAERDFESRASTNFTTPALRDAYNAAIKTRNGKHKLFALCCWHRCLHSSGDFRGFSLANIDGGCVDIRSEEHTSELQSLMRISYAVFCLKKKIKKIIHNINNNSQNEQR